MLHECRSDLRRNEHYLSSSEKGLDKIEACKGIWTQDLCDTGAALYQLSLQANGELVTKLVPNKPWSPLGSRNFVVFGKFIRAYKHQTALEIMFLLILIAR